MQHPFTKTALTGCLAFLLCLSVKAQYTETFETQTPNLKSFISYGQSFTLTNAFAIFSNRVGIGYNGSKRFIDNSNSTGTSQENTIKTTDAKLFSVQGFWMFLSDDGGINPSPDGSILITGKINGAPVFTIHKTTGFNLSYGADDGFTFMDLSSEGGADHSTAAINELTIQIQGSFDYVAIDDFTWTPQSILPVAVIDFNAVLKSGNVIFNWQTSCESNSSHFLIERSSDGFGYASVGSVKGAGFCNTITHYTTTDEFPLNGTNYYRLIAVDMDGKRKEHGAVIIKNNSFRKAAVLYPNPAPGNNITLELPAELKGKWFNITDVSGKIVQTGLISGVTEKINISKLSKGMYFIQLSSGTIIQWMKY